MINNNTYNDILSAAMESLSVKYSELREHSAEFANGIYTVEMATDFQRHQCMIDADSMEVLGLMSEPAVFSYPYSME